MDENRHTLEILQVQFQTTTISKYHNKESQMIFFGLSVHVDITFTLCIHTSI